ncbi:DUF4190 domain-containing protein [Streptomyces sp. NPDC004111]|uniref:DUF4190 domain-containing protein n=1 Tax=Streptomyces sp. NPDC004111 TaxID=3364690 RepID=UPI0036942747
MNTHGMPNTHGTAGARGTLSAWGTASSPGTAVPPHRTAPANGLARTALVLGVVGLSTSIFVIGGLVGGIGLVLGVVALATAGRTGTGRGRALAGVVTSLIAIVVSALAAALFVWYADKTQECYRPDSFQQYKNCVHKQFTGN